MLSNNDVNRYNSSRKGIVDAWYAQNLSSKTSMLEDTVYCNARNITNYGGWNPDGVSYASSLRFKNYDHTTNLVCPNETDQFTVNNNKAKLTYPVALLQDEEKYNINTNSLMSTGANWWELSPYDFAQGGANVFNVFVGGVGYYHVYYAYGARPVVSLASDSIISSGTGSETDPWVVE